MNFTFYENNLPGKYINKLINSYVIVKQMPQMMLFLYGNVILETGNMVYSTFFVSLGLLGFLATMVMLWKMGRVVKKKNLHIKGLEDRSINSLSGLLPEKRQKLAKFVGVADARRYELVTVLFSDIQGFTKIAEELNPEVLIDQLDTFFYHFDTVVEKYNIEKIKTIGDAYMCAGGIPHKNRTNPIEVVLAAIEMQRYMDMLNDQEKIWDVRFGVHTGSVIAGTVGHKKLSYDIWGDTVNTASRMESSGEAGKINISGHTYSLVKEYFNCEYRGKMPVKYKGDIDMYFVSDIREELKDTVTGEPNEKFYIKLQLLQLGDLEDSVIKILENETPATLYYHNVKHAWDLYVLTELYGRAEELDDKDMLAVRTAGLIYNIGYLYDYENFEEESIRFAQTILRKYKYTLNQIEDVCKLIAFGNRGETALVKSEKVFSDALYSYIGRIDFEEMIVNMYKEQKEYHKNLNPVTWKNDIKERIQSYSFYTSAAKALQEVDKETQLQVLNKVKL